MAGVVLGVVESHDLGAFGLVHVFWIVVVFIVELLDHLVVVVLLCLHHFVEFEGA